MKLFSVLRFCPFGTAPLYTQSSTVVWGTPNSVASSLTLNSCSRSHDFKSTIGPLYYRWLVGNIISGQFGYKCLEQPRSPALGWDPPPSGQVNSARLVESVSFWDSLLRDANVELGSLVVVPGRVRGSTAMLYDVYLDGTAEYVGQIRDRSQTLWKAQEVRVIPYRGRLTNFIIISTDQLSDRVTTVVAKVVVDEAA